MPQNLRYEAPASQNVVSGFVEYTNPENALSDSGTFATGTATDATGTIRNRYTATDHDTSATIIWYGVELDWEATVTGDGGRFSLEHEDIGVFTTITIDSSVSRATVVYPFSLPTQWTEYDTPLKFIPNLSRTSTGDTCTVKIYTIRFLYADRLADVDIPG